jgi:hypothetical protein
MIVDAWMQHPTPRLLSQPWLATLPGIEATRAAEQPSSPPQHPFAGCPPSFQDAELTHWGSIAYIGGRIGYTALYVSGIPLIRSLFWNVAVFGMLTVLAAPFVPH